MSRYICIHGHLCLYIVNYICSLQWTPLRSMSQPTVHMEMFVWWEALISMKVEWRCASMTSGGQCVMTTGVVLMLQLSVNNWDIHTLEVS